MNLQFYLEKLHSSEEFQNFIKENPHAFLCSGFLSIDKEKSGNQVHFDYFIPKEKVIVSFQMESEVKKVPLEKYDDKIPGELSTDFDVDFNDLESMIVEKMKNEEIKNKIQKIILSLQKIEEKHFLTGTVFISMLGLLKVTIDLENMEFQEFEKKSLFEIMNVIKK